MSITGIDAKKGQGEANPELVSSFLSEPRTKAEIDANILKLIQNINENKTKVFQMYAYRELHPVVSNLLPHLGKILDECNLEGISFACTAVTNSPASVLANALKNRKLASLDLTSTTMDEVYLQNLAEGFKNTGTHINRLNLSQNILLSTENAGREIANLAKNVHAGEINLANCRLSFENMRVFLENCQKSSLYKVTLGVDLWAMSEAEATILATRLRGAPLITEFEFALSNPKVKAIINAALEDNIRDAAFVATPYLDGQMIASERGLLPSAITDLTLDLLGGAPAVDGATLARKSLAMLPSLNKHRREVVENNRLVESAIATIVDALKAGLETQIIRIKDGSFFSHHEEPLEGVGRALEALGDKKGTALEKIHPLWRNALPQLPGYFGKFNKETAEIALAAYTLALAQIPNIPGLIKSGQRHIHIPLGVKVGVKVPEINWSFSDEDPMEDELLLDEIRKALVEENAPADQEAAISQAQEAVIAKATLENKNAVVARFKWNVPVDSDSDDDEDPSPVLAAAKAVLKERAEKAKAKKGPR
jgi:hypothetical protein